MSLPVTLNEQPLVLSSPSAHKTTMTSVGILPKKWGRQDRIKLALNPCHCSKPFSLEQFSKDLQRGDIWSLMVVLKLNHQIDHWNSAGDTAKLSESCTSLMDILGWPLTTIQDCTAMQLHQWLQHQSSNFSQQ